MASYVMEFSVSNPLSYLSHLELMKVFRQSFRRSGFPVSYSEGFNPHMKLSFAIAKGVGLESDGELLEIETENNIDIDDFYLKINSVLPAGLKINAIKEKKAGKKSLSSMLKSAQYMLFFDKLLYEEDFNIKMNKSEMLMEVKTKKNIGIKDLKEYILGWKIVPTGVIIEVYAGSDKNLRIDNLVKYLDMDIKVKRLKLLGADGPIIENIS